MLFSWFNAAAAKQFGTDLARFYVERVPADSAANEKKFAAKTKEVLDKMALRVAQFKEANPLNTYRKAQLGNAFKWTLRDAGYDSAYIDRLTSWLVTRL
jgi:hypothetical protein